jgi:DNA-binding XRE family transcriptional regulator
LPVREQKTREESGEQSGTNAEKAIVTEQVGYQLGRLRRAAGWSLGQLAQRAGVSKATLSQWESGRHLPRMPELEATLTALGTTPAQRALVLVCLEAPRALRHLNTSSALPLLGPLPATGDLLRAMRLRAGWTQSQLA